MRWFLMYLLFRPFFRSALLTGAAFVLGGEFFGYWHPVDKTLKFVGVRSGYGDGTDGYLAFARMVNAEREYHTARAACEDKKVDPKNWLDFPLINRLEKARRERADSSRAFSKRYIRACIKAGVDIPHDDEAKQVMTQMILGDLR